MTPTGIQLFQLLKPKLGERETEALINFVDVRAKENKQEIQESNLKACATKEELWKVKEELKEEISSVKFILKEDIVNLRTELKGDMANLQGDIARVCECQNIRCQVRYCPLDVCHFYSPNTFLYRPLFQALRLVTDPARLTPPPAPPPGRGSNPPPPSVRPSRRQRLKKPPLSCG